VAPPETGPEAAPVTVPAVNPRCDRAFATASVPDLTRLLLNGRHLPRFTRVKSSLRPRLAFQDRDIEFLKAAADAPRWAPKTGQSWTPENRPVR
jgi:hypothetical protein